MHFWRPDLQDSATGRILAAKYFIHGRNPNADYADSYLLSAIGTYKDWGATALVEHLCKSNPSLTSAALDDVRSSNYRSKERHTKARRRKLGSIVGELESSSSLPLKEKSSSSLLSKEASASDL